MIDIDKLARLLKDIFAEGYCSGHADGKSGNQPTKLSAGTHAEILVMAEASNKQIQSIQGVINNDLLPSLTKAWRELDEHNTKE